MSVLVGESAVQSLFGKGLARRFVVEVVVAHFACGLRVVLRAREGFVQLFAGLGGVKRGLAPHVGYLFALPLPQVAHNDAEVLLALLQLQTQLPHLPLQSLVRLIFFADLE